MNSITTILLGLLVLSLVTAPAIYLGLTRLALEKRVDYDEDIAYHQVGVITVLGTSAWALVNAFFGWIPLIGLILPPLVWIVVIEWYTASDWTVATMVGLLVWALSALAYHGVGLAAF